MSLEEGLAKINTGLEAFTDQTSSSVNIAVDDTYRLLKEMRENTNYHISTTQKVMIDGITLLHLNASLHIQRVMDVGSPTIIAIIAAIAQGVAVVVKFVKALMATKVIQLLLTLHKLAYAISNDYRDAVNQVMKKVSNFSKAVGLGAAGVSMAINIARCTKIMISGMDQENEDKAVYDFASWAGLQLSSIQSLSEKIAKDPNAWVCDMFESASTGAFYDSSGWSKRVFGMIDQATDLAAEALENVSGVLTQLQDFVSEMPDFIRDHIPQNLLDAVNKADIYIDDVLIPELVKTKSNIDIINSQLEEQRKKAAELAAKMGRPGDIMVGVDDLPDYAKQTQLKLIDDVSSREMARRNEEEAAKYEQFFKDSSLITEALTAPTPEPVMLTLETPERSKALGIVAEPHETWFVKSGDY
jgi:hypothetical protein